MYFKRYIPKEVSDFAVTSAFKHAPTEQLQQTLRGSISGLISVKCEGDIQVDRAAKFVWDAILDEYLFTEGGSVVENIKRAMNAGSRKLLELMKHDKELEEKGIDLNFALVVIKDKTAYLGIFGSQDLYLYKNSDFLNISEILSENRVSAASIAIDDSDLVLMGSSGVIEGFVKDIESGLDTREVLDSFERNSSKLTEGQGMLLVSRDETLEKVVVKEKEEVEEKGEELEGEKVVEKGDVAQQNSRVGDSKGSKVDGMKIVFANGVENAKKFSGDVSKRVSPMLSKLGIAASRFLAVLKGKMDTQYGRKLWYKRLLSKLSLSSFGDGNSGSGIAIDGYKLKNLRSKRFASVGLIILAVILIFVGARLSNNAKQARLLHAEVVAVLEEVNGYIDDAQDQVLNDREQAALSVFNATEKLAELDGKELSIVDSTEVSKVRSELEKLDDQINKRERLSEDSGISSFLDTGIKFGEGSNPTDITIYKDDFGNEFLFVTDSGLASVYRVAIFDGSVQKVADKSGLIINPQYIDLGNEGIYVYDKQNGVVKSPFTSNGTNKDFVSLVGLSVDDIGVDDISELAIFTQTDNVYLLSNSLNSVLKSTRTGSGGYGLPFPYIESDTLSSATDFFGDLSIYVLTAGSTGLERYIFDFTSGEIRLSAVGIVGLSPDFSSLSAGFTGATLDNRLYAFDKDTKRILVFEKPKESINDSLHPNEMWLLKQYIYRGNRDDVFNNVKDFVVDSKEESMYILDGNRIWKIGL